MAAPHSAWACFRNVDWRGGLANPGAGLDVMRTMIPNMVEALYCSLTALLRRRESGRRGRGNGIVVDQVITDLEILNRSTERDFLAVGEKLMEIRATARQISSDMAALTELISGGNNASLALTKILEHSREMDAGIEQSGQTLLQVRDHANRIRLAFAGLRNTVAVFRTLCTLTRIETSRLGSCGTDFGDLAAEVGPLSESIQASGEGVLDASSRLGQAVQFSIRRGSDLRVRQLKELRALISDVIKSLEAFEGRRRQAAETSAREAAQYEAVGNAVDGVVRSIQFHDITRQQVEHVVQALGQLRSECENRRAGPGGMPAGARAILALQSSQLRGAAEVFTASMERMEHDLESIALSVQKTAEASRALTGVSTDDENSFFLQMEAHFTVILEILGTCSAAQSEVESTAAGLEETISSMRVSVGEIRSIEIRIRRIATNATIRATHIGSAGNALNVIAEVMQRLVIDSNTKTEDVAGTLDAMREAARRVSGRSGAGLGTNELIGEMQRAVVELHTSSECCFSRVNQIVALGARLADDICVVRNGFSAGLLFAQVVDRARRELELFGVQTAGETLEGVEGTPTPQLESLAKRYTMQMERDVHESLTGGAAMAAAPAEASGIALAEGDLGDNVELF
jgi:hypothetical protein